ncbi:MAG TPA: hypothetical protein PKN44_13655 [Bacteroidales bacterium]|nr:hypothetical protein [Bacteroidales bacterium]HPS49870.1 hypothetical protein [Bacteroidales bacterium]
MNLRKVFQALFKNKFPLNSQIFYYLSFLVIAMITMYPLFTTGFGNGDDMGNFLITRLGKVLWNANMMAELQGRFQFLIISPIQNIPFYFDNQFVFKLFHVLPILICLCLFCRIVFLLTQSKELSALYVLLFFVVAQVSRHTSLFVTYPFCFPFSLSLLLCAFLLVHHFQKTNKYRYLIFSAILFAIGLLFYEVYILFIVFAGLSLIYFNVNTGKRGFLLLKKIIVQTLPFIVVVICFLAAYVIYGHMHPSDYEGTKMTAGNVTAGSFFTVLWKLSYTAFPLTVYDSLREFFKYKSDLIDGYRDVVPYLFSQAHLDWIIKAVLVCALGYYILINVRRISYRNILICFICAVMLIFFPHIPLALTNKYTYFVTTQGMIGYVTTFFSLFGVLLLIAVICALLLNLTANQSLVRHLTALVISVGFTLCGFLTDFSNYYVTQDIHQANIRMSVVNEMIKSDAFKAIPQSSNIYAAELWNNPFYMASGVTAQNFEWSYYIYACSEINQGMVRDENEFLKLAKKINEPSYRINYWQAYKTDDALLVLARLKIPDSASNRIDSVSERVLVVFYSKYKEFTVTFKRQSPFPMEKTRIKINHIEDVIDPGEYVEFAVSNTRLNNPATIITIECPSILIRSIHVSNLITSGCKMYFL